MQQTAAQTNDWLLTTADFQTQAIVLNSINDKSITIAASSSETDVASPAPANVDLDRLLLLERAVRPGRGAARFSLVLADGDRLAGQPAAIDGDNLVWDTALLGRLTLPFKSIAAIVSIAQNDARATGKAGPGPTTAPQTEDIVTLLNGDSVRGIIVSIDAQAVSVQQPGGDKTPVPLDSITRVSFVSTGAAPLKRGPRAFRITLADSSAVTASSLKLENRSLALTLPAGARNLPLDSVVAIEQINGPVTWLSAIAPTESIQTSLLDTSWPARMDHAVDGGPVRFADRTYTHGIGVHAYSRLTFPIDPSSQSFRTQYAIAGQLPYADVTVRIKLDGQTVHEQANFHSGILAKPVTVDVSGHKQLTLEVDFGGNSDVQDRFNWIEPALLNFKP